MAATKAMRSLRSWSFETFNNNVLHLVAMVTPDDVKANVEYLRLADEFVVVPGGSNKNNYADVDLVVATARRLCVDAVWPGWGHASENPRLPLQLASENIAFLGPPSSAMDAVGDKIAANILAQSVGVNVIPWSGTGVTTPTTEIDKATFAKATVHSAHEAVECAKRIGFPLMVKASEGGGGKGIRMVQSIDALASAYNQVCNEVVGSPVFLQKLSQNARHLEVQVVADKHGNAISLYGRDCSVQRRHQKIIEEGPVTVAPRSVCEELEQGAVRLAKKVGYSGAGTVEYLYNGEEYSFLEVNPRLQVEHPVTEAVTGVNIPSVQLMIAMGIPLYCMPDIRNFYGEDRDGTTPIDFDVQRPCAPKGHCMAVRITAEDPSKGFRPTSGSIAELTFRSIPGVTAHFSVRPPGGVHQFADSQFGHLFALAPTREAAACKLSLALRDMVVRGEISTTVHYLKWLIAQDAFRSDEHDTAWLDGLIARKEGPDALSTYIKVLCGMLVACRDRHIEKLKNARQKLQRGVTPAMKEFDMLQHKLSLILENVRFHITVSLGGSGHYFIRGEGWENNVAIHAECMELQDEGLLVLVDKRLHAVYRDMTFKGGLKIDIDGQTVVFPNDSDPTKLLSPATGKLIQYLVPNGGKVMPGAAYAEIESMKMVLPLVSTLGGKIHHAKSPGANLDTGDLLAHLELSGDGAQDLNSVTDFKGNIPVSFPRQESQYMLDTYIDFEKKLNAVNFVLDGFDSIGNPLVDLLKLIKSPALPFGQLTDVRAKLVLRNVDKELLAIVDSAVEILEQVSKIAEQRHTALQAKAENPDEPAMPRTMSQLVDDVSMAVTQLKNELEELMETASRENGHANSHVKKYGEEDIPEVWQFIRYYQEGYCTYELILCEQFVLKYLGVEEHFSDASGRTFEETIQSLNDAMDDVDAVLAIGRSHSAIKHKNRLILLLLEHAKAQRMVSKESFQQALHRLSNLDAAPYSRVAQCAKVILMEHYEIERSRSRQWAKIRKELGHANGDDSLPGSPIVSSRRLRVNIPGDGDFQPGSPKLNPTRYLRASELADDGFRGSPRFVSSGGNATRSRGDSSVDTHMRVHEMRQSNSRSPSSGYGLSDDDLEARARSNDENAEANTPRRRHSDTGAKIMAAASLANSMMDGADDITDVEGTPEASWYDLFNSADDAIRESTMRSYYIAYGAKDVAIVRDHGTIRVNFGNAASMFVARDRDQLQGVLESILHDESRAAADRNLQAIGFFVAGRLCFENVAKSTQTYEDHVQEYVRGLDALNLFAPSVRNVAFTVVRSDDVPPEHYLLARKSLDGGSSGTVAANGTIDTPVFRNIHVSREVETVLAFHLELERLSTFVVTCKSLHEPRRKFVMRSGDPNPREEMGFVCKADYRIGVFLGEEKSFKSSSTRDRRVFVRSVVYNRDVLLGGVEKEHEDEASRNSSSRRLRSMSAYFGRGSRTSTEVAGSLASSKSGASSGDMNNSPGRRSLSDIGMGDMDNPIPQIVAPDSVLIDILDKLELAVGEENTAWNFIFVNLCDAVDKDDVRLTEDIMHAFVAQCANDLRRLKVAFIEFKIACGRIVAYNPTGYKFDIECQLRTAPKQSPLPYPLLDRIQRKRMIAQNLGSTYAYDLISIFQHCAKDIATREVVGTKGGASAQPKSMTLLSRSLSESMRGAVSASAADAGDGNDGGVDYFQAVELVLDPAAKDLRPIHREPGHNDVGMVVWRCTVQTPEFPAGRSFFLVASDITFQSGSFSPEEDDVYVAAYNAALAEGLPVVYISANSGARIGLDEEVKKLFRVKWKDVNDETKGFDYLYLDGGDYERICNLAERTPGYRAPTVEKKVQPDGSVHWCLLDIPGGIGVECLVGSGRIASVTSKANAEIVTIAYVTGRAVGIGAYISRLASRIIQHKNAPLILTGSSALNKVLGRNVYTSNDQIGGPRVMARNGVSQKVVDDDVQGIETVLNWLRYVPAKKGGELPCIRTNDQSNRRLMEAPTKSPSDPRLWLHDFFDIGSFDECMALWGKTVITARARLSGLPCGVVAVETRVTEKFTPADPALDMSTQSREPQPGQVWFPDSAYKTSQAITDMNREGLPLFIFANWRGFAGGLRDMFSEILKYGSYIVDALRVYKQPIFTYIPHEGELRGGAWVVIDTTINPEMMEMYASSSARGGVLEPEGIIDIKFRAKDIGALMERASHVPSPDGEPHIQARKDAIPSYKQVATHFAALHDTPEVMRAKGAIKSVVPWRESREFFSRRLRRRCAEERIKHLGRTMDPDIDSAGVAALLDQLRDCITSNENVAHGPLHVDAHTEVQRALKLLRRGYIARQASTLIAEDRVEVEAAMARSAGDDIGASLLALGSR